MLIVLLLFKHNPFLSQQKPALGKLVRNHPQETWTSIPFRSLTIDKNSPASSPNTISIHTVFAVGSARNAFRFQMAILHRFPYRPIFAHRLHRPPNHRSNIRLRSLPHPPSKRTMHALPSRILASTRTTSELPTTPSPTRPHTPNPPRRLPPPPPLSLPIDRLHSPKKSASPDGFAPGPLSGPRRTFAAGIRRPDFAGPRDLSARYFRRFSADPIPGGFRPAEFPAAFDRSLSGGLAHMRPDRFSADFPPAQFRRISADSRWMSGDLISTGFPPRAGSPPVRGECGCPAAPLPGKGARAWALPSAEVFTLPNSGIPVLFRYS